MSTLLLAMKSLAVLLCVLLAGCATTQPASSYASISFNCAPAVFDCSGSSEGAILMAVVGLGYPVRTITIAPSSGYDCAVPPPAETAPQCLPPASDLPTAYVTFVGTDKIAHVQIRTGPLSIFGDAVVSFDIPPAPGASF